MVRSRLHFICARFTETGQWVGACGCKHRFTVFAECHVAQLNAQRWPSGETWAALRIGGKGDPGVVTPQDAAASVVAWHLAARSACMREGDPNLFARPQPELPWVDRGLPAESRAS